MNWHPFFKRSVEVAYREGVGDFVNHGMPSPMKYGEPGANRQRCEALEAARRRGFEDAKAGEVKFPLPYDVWADALARIRG